MVKKGRYLVVFLAMIIVIFIGLKFLDKTHVDAEDRGGRNEINTYLKYLIHLSNTNKNIKMAVIGSSVTKGSGSSAKEFNWPTRLHRAIVKEDKKLKNVQLINLGFSGYKAQDLLQENKVLQLIREEPDFVIFETSVINNFRQSQSIEETITYIDKLLSTIKRELPNTKILVVSPNPILTEGKNDVGLSYKDYINETRIFLERNGYNFINIFADMSSYLTNRNKRLSDVLADEIHPNDEGYGIWTEILLNYIEHESFTL